MLRQIGFVSCDISDLWFHTQIGLGNLMIILLKQSLANIMLRRKYTKCVPIRPTLHIRIRFESVMNLDEAGSMSEDSEEVIVNYVSV